MLGIFNIDAIDSDRLFIHKIQEERNERWVQVAQITHRN